MAFEGKTLKICNCNRTMALDAKALAAALQSGTPLTIHTELCRREVGAFDAAIAEGERPSIISCHTHIAHGAPNAQDTAEAHGSPLGEEEVRLGLHQVGAQQEAIARP